MLLNNFKRLLKTFFPSVPVQLAHWMCYGVRCTNIHFTYLLIPLVVRGMRVGTTRLESFVTYQWNGRTLNPTSPLLLMKYLHQRQRAYFLPLCMG